MSWKDILASIDGGTIISTISAVIAVTSLAFAHQYRRRGIRERAIERRWSTFAELVRHSPPSTVLLAHGIENKDIPKGISHDLVVYYLGILLVSEMYHITARKGRGGNRTGPIDQKTYIGRIIHTKEFRELWRYVLKPVIGKNGDDSFAVRIDETFALSAGFPSGDQEAEPTDV